MTHTPTFGDAAADLKRCFYSSLSGEGFLNKEYFHFLECAVDNIDIACKNNKDVGSSEKVQSLKKVVARLHNKMEGENKRRENLLLASQVLLDLHTEVSKI